MRIRKSLKSRGLAHGNNPRLARVKRANGLIRTSVRPRAGP